MKKSGLIVFVIIAIIALGIVLGITGKPENIENNVQNKNAYTNNIQNTKNNEVIPNNVNNVENNTENVENTETEIIDEEPKTEIDKAIDIVKLDWGDNLDSVTITVDGLNNDGRYIVSVRDKNSTQALAFYTVNVKDETFTKKEMN